MDMDKKKVEYYKKRLVTTQDELLRLVTKSERDGREADEEATQDIADKAANSYTKEFLFHQSDRTGVFCRWSTKPWNASKTARTASVCPARGKSR